MKAIIQSYSPEEIERIARGEQTIKVCKTAPKGTPFKVYMYKKPYAGGTKIINEVLNGVYSGGKVVGDYVCERVDTFKIKASCATSLGDKMVLNEIAGKAGIRTQKLVDCFRSTKEGKALHIHAVKFYDEPKELEEFKTIKCTNKRGSCSDCDIKPNCIQHLSRPPQGWQYVEEL